MFTDTSMLLGFSPKVYWIILNNTDYIKLTDDQSNGHCRIYYNRLYIVIFEYPFSEFKFFCSIQNFFDKFWFN